MKNGAGGAERGSSDPRRTHGYLLRPFRVDVCETPADYEFYDYLSWQWNSVEPRVVPQKFIDAFHISDVYMDGINATVSSETIREKFASALMTHGVAVKHETATADMAFPWPPHPNAYTQVYHCASSHASEGACLGYALVKHILAGRVGYVGRAGRPIVQPKVDAFRPRTACRRQT